VSTGAEKFSMADGALRQAIESVSASIEALRTAEYSVWADHGDPGREFTESPELTDARSALALLESRLMDQRRRHVVVENAVVYRAAGRRWFTKAWAYRAAAKAELRRDSDQDELSMDVRLAWIRERAVEMHEEDQ